MRLLVFISLFIVLFFSFCKKEEPKALGDHCTNDPTKYISPEILNFKFKQGTYWVFLDSATMITDTLKVVSAAGNVIAYSYCPNNYHEVYTFSTGNDLYTLEENSLLQNMRYESGDPSAEIYRGYARKLDSMFIYDRYYKNVEGYMKTASSGGDNALYYMNTEFGFLRKDVFWGTTNFLRSQKLLTDKHIVR